MKPTRRSECTTSAFAWTLPFEQSANPYVDEVFEHQTFFTRLHHFVLMSDAFIVAPGGIGTVLEAMMIWQLLQVRHLNDTLLIFAGPMWKGLMDWAKEMMLRPGFELATAQDMQIPHCVPDAEKPWPSCVSTMLGGGPHRRSRPDSAILNYDKGDPSHGLNTTSAKRQRAQNPSAPGSPPTRCASRCSTISRTCRHASRDIATPHDWYMALAYSVRDRLLARWVETAASATPLAT